MQQLTEIYSICISQQGLHNHLSSQISVTVEMDECLTRMIFVFVELFSVPTTLMSLCSVFLCSVDNWRNPFFLMIWVLLLMVVLFTQLETFRHLALHFSRADARWHRGQNPSPLVKGSLSLGYPILCPPESNYISVDIQLHGLYQL